MDFRPNVAAVIINNEGKILIGLRTDIPDAWQLPQGGIEKNESKNIAVLREVEEETGLKPDDLEILSSTSEIRYTFPENIEQKMGFRGQCQTFFLLKITNPDRKPVRSDEFCSFEWVDRDEVLKRVVNFKRNSYVEAFRQIFGEQDG